MDFDIDWDAVAALTALAIAVVTGAFFIVRHLWISSKNKAILKTRVDKLDEIAANGQEDHKKIFEKIGRIDKRVVSIETKLDMLLKK